ncbi:MAG: electron transfer flavoprotein subunit alpha/FixB family protein [Rhodospirillales bacterium]|nr:electron transfer flavoprotein subunit alpha/FixB family protein [Rhodospirillales bacterium]MCB9973577.1 electron transfer flavoprotein subunit alpha/FixB family protein [Rhodospirillales bacterium]MCB9979619.1 electron transfer flavoprotein subunit alpha/FixB family protein [Rhodospirillales bacterium]
MTILIIAEHHGAELSANTANVVSAAKKIGGDIHILVSGKDIDAVATQAARIGGVAKVLKAENAALDHHLAEEMQSLIMPMAKAYDVLMAPASTFGKNITPRLAAQLDTQQISDIIGIESPDTFLRPIYGGQAIAKVQSRDAQKVITVRPTAFDPVTDAGDAPIEDVSHTKSSLDSAFVTLQAAASDRPELTSARVVISGGRGVGSKENFDLIEALADKLGGAVGASRAAVDAGFVPNDWQVGQTGKVVAPELYIAVGISGAIQHLAGMKESKVIVAINKDEEAPIFQVADYGLVADLFDAVPELIEKL